MNPESPTPREQLEARLTALLLGELSPDESAALQEIISKDAQLAALHARLKQTIELVRETAADPAWKSAPSRPRHAAPRRGTSTETNGAVQDGGAPGICDSQAEQKSAEDSLGNSGSYHLIGLLVRLAPAVFGEIQGKGTDGQRFRTRQDG